MTDNADPIHPVIMPDEMLENLLTFIGKVKTKVDRLIAEKSQAKDTAVRITPLELQAVLLALRETRRRHSEAVGLTGGRSPADTVQ
jgi:hypothetical protein